MSIIENREGEVGFLKELAEFLVRKSECGRFLQGLVVYFQHLSEIVEKVRKQIKIRNPLDDKVLWMLYKDSIIRDKDVAPKLQVNVDDIRRSFTFLEGQLRSKVYLGQDNQMGWVLRVKAPFEEVQL